VEFTGFMWIILNKYRTRYILKHYPIPQDLWIDTIGKLSLVSGVSSSDLSRLRDVTTLFLYNKRFTGALGLQTTPEMRLIIAVQACLLILNLKQEDYSGWVEIIIYPAAFRVIRDRTDSTGVVHSEDKALSGESWSNGPVILSWLDIIEDIRSNTPGCNVVIHEFAHKLDMQNGVANGMPPLHANMNREDWTKALSAAYGFLNQQLKIGNQSTVNAYAATDPAEFFAVVSEYFFTAPNLLYEHCPQVYVQLKQYYRQDPITRSIQPTDL